MSGPDLNPEVAPLRFLLGSWMGAGKGEYATIQPFEYGEEVRFWHVGKPFIAYTQRTWALDDGRPLHSETGFWRKSVSGCKTRCARATPSPSRPTVSPHIARRPGPVREPRRRGTCPRPTL